MKTTQEICKLGLQFMGTLPATELTTESQNREYICEVFQDGLGQEKKVVEILVKGGHAEPGHIPDGVEVHVKDYDIDGAPEEYLLKDEWGWYILTKW